MRGARWRARSRSKSRITLAARRGRRSALSSPCRCARPACIGAAASVRSRNVLTRRFAARNRANARITHARSHGRLLTNVLAFRTNAPATCIRTAVPFRARSEYRFPISMPALECRGAMRSGKEPWRLFRCRAVHPEAPAASEASPPPSPRRASVHSVAVGGSPRHRIARTPR
jgi:hypothetical protein